VGSRARLVVPVCVGTPDGTKDVFLCPAGAGAERVTFQMASDGGRLRARKGRTYAHVVTDEGTEVHVPSGQSPKRPGDVRK